MKTLQLIYFALAMISHSISKSIAKSYQWVFFNLFRIWVSFDNSNE